MGSKWSKYIRLDYYDDSFKRFADMYCGDIDIDWRWFKAQAIAESHLAWNAVSPVGAKGIMQIMPRTWKEIIHELNILGLEERPEGNIQAGIYYDRKMWSIWKSKRTEEQRRKLMFASYNAGASNIMQAQIKAEKAAASILNTDSWNVIQLYLVDITGKENSEQTIEYVERIEEIYSEMISEETNIQTKEQNDAWKVDRVSVIDLQDMLNKLERNNFDIKYMFKHNRSPLDPIFTVISKQKA